MIDRHSKKFGIWLGLVLVPWLMASSLDGRTAHTTEGTHDDASSLALLTAYLQRAALHAEALEGRIPNVFQLYECELDIARLYAAYVDREAASAHLSRALDIAGDFLWLRDRIEAYADIALLYAEISDEPAARRTVQQAFKLVADSDESDPSSMYGPLVRMQAQAGWIEEALDTYERMTDQHEASVVAMDIAVAKVQTGRFDDAVAMARATGGSPAVLRVMLEQVRDPQFDLTPDFVEQIARIESFEIWCSFAVVRAKLGDDEGATVAFERARSLADQMKDTSGRAAALKRIVMEHLRAGMLDAAAGTAEAVPLRHQRAVAFAAVAEAMARDGHDDAPVALDEALRIARDNAQEPPARRAALWIAVAGAQAALGQLHDASESTEAARDAVRTVDEEPTRGDLLASIGISYARLGSDDQALAMAAVAQRNMRTLTIDQQQRRRDLVQSIPLAAVERGSPEAAFDIADRMGPQFDRALAYRRIAAHQATYANSRDIEQRIEAVERRFIAMSAWLGLAEGVAERICARREQTSKLVPSAKP